MVLTDPQKIETLALTKGTLKGLLWGQMPANSPRIHERQAPEISPLPIKGVENTKNGHMPQLFFAGPTHDQHGPSLLRRRFRSCELILATCLKGAGFSCGARSIGLVRRSGSDACRRPNGYYAAPILILCQYSAIQTRLLYKRTSRPLTFPA
jgi:hypothetical protein